jgi:hypothetical protein
MLEKFDKQRALAVEEERHHHFTGTCVYGFGFLFIIGSGVSFINTVFI